MATFLQILAILSQIEAAAPTIAQVVSIVEAALAALKGNDQAAMDKALADATALADSLAP